MSEHTVEERLAEQGIKLPEAPKPAANYVPWVRSGNMVYISGQLPMVDGETTCHGQLGRDVDLEQGVKAARLCAVNILAQVKAACDGDLEKIARCVRLGGFVASTPEFEQHPSVVNGASDLMAAAFGEAGAHARAAVGVSSLPLGVSVEVEALFELKA